MPTATADRLPVACFAPPLTDAKLARYRELAGSLPTGDRVRDAMETLLRCVSAWWELPESTAEPTRWAVDRVEVVDGKRVRRPARFSVTPLGAELVAELWDVTPWMDEFNLLSNAQGTGVFDPLPAGELRDAAFHLLWHAKEITLDREPVTTDALRG